MRDFLGKFALSRRAPPGEDRGRVGADSDAHRREEVLGSPTRRAQPGAAIRPLIVDGVVAANLAFGTSSGSADRARGRGRKLTVKTVPLGA